MQKEIEKFVFWGYVVVKHLPVFFFFEEKIPSRAKYLNCGKSCFYALYFDFSWVLYFPVSNSHVGKKTSEGNSVFSSVGLE